VFKRAEGEGTIRHIAGMDAFRRAHAPYIARADLLPVGARRRDWTQTFLSDGNVVVRHPDMSETLRMARTFARDVRMYAGR
jgi:hypothetical protein